MLVEEIGTEVPINLYLTVLLNPHALHGKGQPEVWVIHLPSVSFKPRYTNSEAYSLKPTQVPECCNIFGQLSAI